MDIKDNIIELYRTSDFEKRVHLFLQHRYLRNEFVEIEANEMLTEHLPAKTTKTKMRQSVKEIFNSIQKRILRICIQS
jgi:hypothetical protein